MLNKYLLNRSLSQNSIVKGDYRQDLQLHSSDSERSMRFAQGSSRVCPCMWSLWAAEFLKVWWPLRLITLICLEGNMLHLQNQLATSSCWPFWSPIALTLGAQPAPSHDWAQQVEVPQHGRSAQGRTPQMGNFAVGHPHNLAKLFWTSL